MKFVVQGTVRVNRTANGEATLFISPISDYKVVHKTKEYVVLVQLVGGERAEVKRVEEILQGRMLPLDRACKVNGSLIDTLVQAAVNGTRIQLEIDLKDVEGEKPEEPEVVGVEVPATQSRPV